MHHPRTYGIARRRQDNQCVAIRSTEEAGLISFDLSQELVNRPEKIAGLTFCQGEVKFLRQAGHTIDQGFDSWFTAFNGARSQVLLPWNYW